ncbi:MAG: DUF4157 domain-containing protein [Bacteroidetes bacterium]|nr:DUF4157 domain-containing protein [Bacteroidota bacterium]
MENAFSTDFSAVKIHTDVQASEMSKGINAKAFTYGNDIYFGEGQYNVDSGEGKHLLAHELTHTLQQNIDSGLLHEFKMVGQPAGSDGMNLFNKQQIIFMRKIKYWRFARK